MGKVKLFCLPYAGGSVAIYTRWRKYLSNSIELYPVELAGRGKRLNTPFYGDFEEAVADVYELIKDELDGAPYAIFGHSMGTILANGLAGKIKRQKHEGPAHMFFSGLYPPHIKKKDKALHALPDKEFMAEILKMGGTPVEFLENQELLNIFIPVLKADFKIIETRAQVPNENRFNCGITVFSGKKDEEVTKEDLLEWEQYTTNECKIYEFEGGHFFIKEQTESIVDIINEVLGGVIKI